jgi:hypothetical protein
MRRKKIVICSLVWVEQFCKGALSCNASFFADSWYLYVGRLIIIDGLVYIFILNIKMCGNAVLCRYQNAHNMVITG